MIEGKSRVKQKSHIRSLDEIDWKILSELEDNSRITIVELSQRIGLSQTPCVERIKRLERDGYIQKYTIQIDPNLVERGFVVFIQVSFENSSNEVFERFADRIQEFVEIEECFMIAGDYDCLLKVRQKDMNAFREIITSKISSIPGIARTSSFAVIDALKSNSKMIDL